MSKVEEFMQEFFRARVVDERNYQAGREKFRRTFFSKDCRYDSRADTLKRFESENIVSIDTSDLDARVVTDQLVPFSRGDKELRLKYHLQLSSSGWVIRSVQIQCFTCKGQGDSNCPCCKGKHWLDTGEMPRDFK